MSNESIEEILQSLEVCKTYVQDGNRLSQSNDDVNMIDAIKYFAWVQTRIAEIQYKLADATEDIVRLIRI